MTQTVIHGDCLEVLPTLGGETVSLVCTDPPYALTGHSRGGSPRVNNPNSPAGRHNLQPKGFMGMQWDGKLADPAVWRECFRVLKPGGFAFVFCASRQDSLWRMLRDLEEAGFETGYSAIVWAYLSGCPDAGVRGRGH